MPIHHLQDLTSKQLAPYRHLRTTNLTRFSGRFIAESKPLVQRLVASGITVESFLVDAKYLEEAVQWLPQDADIYVVSGDQVSELIGFDFHRGYLACGIRPEYRSLPNGLGVVSPTWLGVMLVGVQDPENMGSILRSCAALGIADVIIGPECVDPFARRVLRVSMGNAFKIRFFETDNPREAMVICSRNAIESVAACLAKSSEELSVFRRHGPTLVILGNEAHGLPQAVQDAAQRSIRIDMELGTDSLNVSVAAGIILHHLRRSRP
jgi:tRNA G18 (ribose-2'-O)-methylase SpoU